jgi:hypothetical protein
MRFFMTYISKAPHGQPPADPVAMQKFVQEMLQSGILLDTGGILPLSQGARVKLDGGKFAVLDGPFPETKEMVIGYAIVQVKSRDEAVEVARRFMTIAGDGWGDIQQILGPQDEPPPGAPQT